MQHPTLTNVHIRTAADAHKLFYAVQLGLLTKIEKRLDAHERSALRPGDVYVWEERGPTSDSFSVSMERFTEGKSWTASRVREDFLMYFENQRKAKGRNGSQKAKSSENQVVRPGENDQFIKQTYSVFRDDPDDPARGTHGEEAQKKPRKWHLNAYFTKLTEGQLRSIDDIPFLRDLEVPEGIFKSAKSNKGTKKGDGSKAPSSSVKRTFAPFPSNYRAHGQEPPHPRAPEPPVASTSALPPPPEPAYAPHTDDPALQCIMPMPLSPSSQQQHQPQLQLQPHTYPAFDHSMHDDYLQDPTAQGVFGAHDLSPFSAFSGAGYGFDGTPGEYTLPCGSVHTSPSPSVSSGSWGSRKMSASPALSHISASPVSPFADACPLTDDGRPYRPAPLPGALALAIPPVVAAAAAAVPARGLPPLGSLRRSHPYRRSPTDDRTLRLLARPLATTSSK